jgi:hypothetical protein
MAMFVIPTEVLLCAPRIRAAGFSAKSDLPSVGMTNGTVRRLGGHPKNQFAEFFGENVLTRPLPNHITQCSLLRTESAILDS